MRYFALVFLMVLSFTQFAYAEAPAPTVVNVEGMVCDFCAQALNKVFGKEEVVDRLDVNFDDQTVTVYYKEGVEALSDENIEKMIYWAGYDVVGIRR